MRIRGSITTIPDDLPVPDGTTGEIRLDTDDSLIDTVTTIGGFYTYEVSGHPGPFHIFWDYADTIKNQYSSITGPSAATDIANIPNAFRVFSDGIIKGAGNELLLSGAGTNMNVTVATGLALVRGLLHDQIVTKTFTIEAPDTQMRYDSVVVRVVPAGAGVTTEGKTELAVVKGTPGTTPSVPAQVQTDSLWEVRIGFIQVDPSISAVASNKVFYIPPYAASYIAPNSVGSTQLTAASVITTNIANDAVTSAKILDGTIVAADLADGAVTSAKILDGTIATADLADSSVTTAKLADNSVTSAKIVNGTIVGADIADNTITAAKLSGVVLTGNPTLLPGSEFVATGALSTSGAVRTLKTLACGPLLLNVVYDIAATSFVTIRNAGNTGTVGLQLTIAGGTLREMEFQSVGGVPRTIQVRQTASITGTGASINVVTGIRYLSDDTADVRAGELTIMAIPR